MVTELVGYSIDDLGLALEAMELETPVGGYSQIQLCTESPPGPDALEQVYQAIMATGHTITYPTTTIIDGVPVTYFNIKRDVPLEQYFWPLLVPLLVPVLTLGLVTFGIVKIDTITTSIGKLVIPILAIAGGIAIVAIALARKPAMAYIERGGKIPYLPATTKKSGKPTRSDVEIHTWFERDRQHIEIRDKRNDKTVAQWWDDAVTEMFEDGFFKAGHIRHEGMSGWEFENSVLKYAEDMGMLAKGQEYWPSVVNVASDDYQAATKPQKETAITIKNIDTISGEVKLSLPTAGIWLMLAYDDPQDHVTRILKTWLISEIEDINNNLGGGVSYAMLKNAVKKIPQLDNIEFIESMEADKVQGLLVEVDKTKRKCRFYANGEEKEVPCYYMVKAIKARSTVIYGSKIKPTEFLPAVIKLPVNELLPATDWSQQVKRKDCKECKYVNMCGDIYPDEGKCPSNTGGEDWAKYEKGTALMAATSPKTEFQQARAMWDKAPRRAREGILRRINWYWHPSETLSEWREFGLPQKYDLLEYFKEKHPENFTGLEPPKKSGKMTTNPPTPVLKDGLLYYIHNTFSTSQEANEEARLLRDEVYPAKTLVQPWEGGYVVYEHPLVYNEAQKRWLPSIIESTCDPELLWRRIPESYQKDPCLQNVMKFLRGYFRMATNQSSPKEIEDLANMTSELTDKLIGYTDKYLSGTKEHDQLMKILDEIKASLVSAKFADNPKQIRVLAIDKFAHLSHEENYFLSFASDCESTMYQQRGSTIHDRLIQDTFDCLAGKKVNPKLWFDLATRPIFVEILSSGETDLVPGSLATLEEVEKQNKKMASLKLPEATYQDGPTHRPVEYDKVWPGGLEMEPKVKPIKDFTDEDLMRITGVDELRDKKLAADLQKSIQEEIKAQKDYIARAANAEDVGDKKTADLYKEVAGDEAQHMKEFKERLEDKKKNRPNYIPDTQEFMAQTIQESGWKDKLDQAFQAAIQRVKGT